ncbi:MAG TPA: hypothetical protein VHL78_00280 [Actinomycetota bacterium]|nr:hypothetical protein [Actinomycetota bacterium]
MWPNRPSILWKAALVVAIVATLTAPALPGGASGFDHLEPGATTAGLAEEVPITFVFAGLEPAQVSEPAFVAQLPESYSAVVRSRLWYGVTEHLGLDYTYDYEVIYADAAWEESLFTALGALAQPAERTLFQDLYNDQRKNVIDVGQNHFIDAPTVEKWLIENPPAGVDTARNTVFFINWYGRPDFKFHVYTKFGEPDPDTDYDFGVQRDSRKIVAWGGTTPDDEETGLGALGEHRVWFYDVSAGPEAWGGSYNVDDRDIDGDGFTDIRLPTSWEYFDRNGFRPASALAGDLGKVARYGAINLLFTPSPLYPPYITPDRQPASINLDLNTFEGIPGTDASEHYQTPGLLLDEISEVHRVPYTLDHQDAAFTGEARDCYVKFVRGAKCYPDRPQYHSFANLFLHGALNIEAFWDGGAEYEAMFYNYATTSDISAPFLGFADDNWIDGTQSFTFNFVSPLIESSGYGLTTTQIHEFGHHFGMSHPHDGYDSETGVDYGPSGPYFFAWLADEVNSMMSYIDLNWDYSQFDRDNANRFQAAAYIINANAIAQDILASPNASAAADDLEAADDEIGQARAAMAAHDYVGAFDHALAAYQHVRQGADDAGVEVTASDNGWTVLPPRKEIQGPVAKRGYAYRDPIGPGTQRSLP